MKRVFFTGKTVVYFRKKQNPFREMPPVKLQEIKQEKAEYSL